MIHISLNDIYYENVFEIAFDKLFWQVREERLHLIVFVLGFDK